MAGNSARRGAVRKPGSKKGATVGTGGKNRRSLEGRGPTPPATERTGHPAARRAAAAERRAASGSGRSGGSGGGGGGGGGRGGSGGGGGGGRGGGGRGGGRGAGGRASSAEAVAGRNSVVEALRAHVPATALHVAARIDTDDRVREALKTASARGLPVLETTRGDLDRMTDGAIHQGLVLQVPPYEHASLDDLLARAADAGQEPLVVALDGVTDPRNLGAVVRSAAAFGGHGVLVPERRSVGMTAAAWKTSAGAAARVPVARETNLTRALEAAQRAGCAVVGLDADGDVALRSEDLARVADGPLVLVVGSEGKGLSRLVRSTCDLVASIPMAGPVESLNAGIAAAVALYEVASRRAEADRR
ncbi:23S rRNA (guanosine(2251)-2'-O)-methyltransferase RlmB [Quadrisphaera sp. DSM 44207]|uniref:23S rRNA (guanosine(2251)-2'-O)-methyltransferase RlmB n=1 Tax=Quadrisphaera sp. DSM 44207 TaxID=1881057 RepID=UPI000882D3D4|nr:23S rRNA (guanosine(2251)-2'-O)-methyltransferase RlmB [Quadrisphaera sp. DSM 44207]SDQ62318.1 23S rRNA (guanosine2251-2'-O)-methyltransferase [Quadrisphaera sp. DSM 44207]